MALTQKERDDTKSSDLVAQGKRDTSAYAIPELEKLPLWDREHIKMAANAVNDIRGITDEQRIQARINIAVAADRYGISVKPAQRLHLHLESMAIEMPEVDGHPNRAPFTGIMTRLDIASDFPVGGTTSKRVVIPKLVAEKALPTLLGMAVDHKKTLDGHDRKNKIGIITEAYIGDDDLVLGTPLHIAGFFYAADFPEEVKDIQSQKELLGFSYEAEAFVESMKSDPWVCSSCSFTGAAVLYKDKAAFTSTSINASKGTTMSPEEIVALQKKAADLEAANKELTAGKEKAEAAAKALEAEKLAAASLQKKVKPHADNLRSAATAMEADGIGANADRGHAHVLRKMADSLEANSIMGKIPDTFDGYFYGSRENAGGGQGEFLQASVDTAVKKATEKMADELAAMGTKLSDAEKKVTALSAGKGEAGEAQGDRKSLSAGSLSTLKKLGLDEKVTLAASDIDEAVRKSGLTSVESIALKLNLRAAGILQ